MALSLGSCTEEYDYVGVKAEGQQVYFSNALPTTVELSATESSITVPVNRIDREGELTVPLNVSVSEGSSLTVSDQVTFAAGDSVAYVTISYDPQAIEYGKYDEVTLSIKDVDYTTPYGSSSYTFNAGLSEWRAISGTATFRDGPISSYYGFDPISYSVQIEENILTPGIYRVVNPYGEGSGFNEEYAEDPDAPFVWETQSNSDMIINATDPDFIYISGDFYPGIDDSAEGGRGLMHLFSLVESEAEAEGVTVDALKSMYPEYFGTFKDGVFTFPEIGIYVNFDNTLTPLGYLDTSSLAIALPGYSIRDYSTSFAYSGRFTDPDGSDHPLGTITLGADVASARYAIAADGDDLEATLQGIIDGSISSETITASGTVELNLTEGGIYYMIIVPYSADGEAQEASTTQFMFRASSAAEDWQVVATGTFIYNFMPNFVGDESGQAVGSYYSGSEQATLYQDANLPVSYKIEPFGEDSTLPFIMDAYGNISYVNVPTGSVYEYKGQEFPVYVGDYGILSDAGMTASFYDSDGSGGTVPGAYVFGNVYYIDLGNDYIGTLNGAYELFIPSNSTLNLAPKNAPIVPFKVASPVKDKKNLKPINGKKLTKKNMLKRSAKIKTLRK